MVDRETIVRGCKNILRNYSKGDAIPMAYESFQELLDVMKSMDVVRCKDCKHGEPNDCGEVICDLLMGDDAYRPMKWYCADGERNDNDGTY